MYSVQTSKKLFVSTYQFMKGKQDLGTAWSTHGVYKNAGKSHQDGPEAWKMTGWKKVKVESSGKLKISMFVFL